MKKYTAKAEKKKFIDTHAHLNFEQFDEDRAEVIRRALELGIERIIVPSVNLKDSSEIVELCEKHPQLWAAVGIHPNECENLPENWLETLEHLALHPKVVAIGEIGLDYYRDFSSRERQIEVFKRQIRIARKMNLPMIIHIREAHDDVKKIIEEENFYKGVFHSFSGDENFLEWAVEKNFYTGIGGVITFKNFKKEFLIKKIPLERILLETDCPYLSPHPFRGERNEPSRIPIIAERLAEILQEDVKTIAKASTNNASKLFDIKNPYKSIGGRRFGQNFLINDGVAEKIVNLTGENKIIVEIGAGRGILTSKLKDVHRKIFSVEIDDSLASELSEVFAKSNVNNVVLLNKDILDVRLADVKKYYGEEPVVVGNIPYSITSPIIFYLVDNRKSFCRAILMVQREYAERLCAKTRTKEYGIPTIIPGRYFFVRKKFDVKPNSFSPPPKVQSTVIEIVRRERPLREEVNYEIFAEIVKNSFSHRRKKVIKNLADTYPDADFEKLFSELCIDINARAEELTIEDFCDIAGKLSSMGK
ncbi:ribosomal RNA small subunit methyltransferase A [bacterium]|nr:ribosomal RNA small subunit methyltransferase A [bacterium]